jgi:hypothetical protein
MRTHIKITENESGVREPRVGVGPRMESRYRALRIGIYASNRTLRIGNRHRLTASVIDCLRKFILHGVDNRVVR